MLWFVLYASIHWQNQSSSYTLFIINASFVDFSFFIKGSSIHILLKLSTNPGHPSRRLTSGTSKLPRES